MNSNETPSAAETCRLDALARHDILDTPPELAFDDLTQLAAQICGVPVALISLIDRDRQWFKAKIGFDVAETPRSISFCSRAIETPDCTLVIPDARLDPRFALYPAVTSEPYVRFYAGAPLVTADGHALGTLCVVDFVPRQLTSEQQNALEALARQVVAQLELRRKEQDARRQLATLRQSEDRFRTFFEHAAAGMSLVAIDGSWSRANGAFAALLGYDEGELGVHQEIGVGLVHPSDRALVTVAIRNLFRGAQSTFSRELRCLHRRGHTVWVSATASLLRDPSGQPWAIATQLVDVTARKDAERRQAALFAVTRIISEATSIEAAAPALLAALGGELGWDVAVLWLVDDEADLLRGRGCWSDETLDASAFSVASLALTPARGEGLPGRVWSAAEPIWVDEIAADAPWPRIALAAQMGLRSACCLPLVVQGEVLGAIEFFSRQASPRDRDARLMMEDVSARIGKLIESLRTARELQASERRFGTVAEHAQDAVVSTDSSGNILFFNPAATRVFGYSPQEALGKRIEILMPERFRGAHNSGFARHIATGERRVVGKTVEVAGQRKDGTEFPMELSLGGWVSGGERMFAAIIRDVSERKRVEAELTAAKERAEAATRARSDFLARMSHEIRTPMNGVLGMTELALQTSLSDEQRDYLTTARSSAQDLLGIIDDILDFSKIEARKLKLEAISFGLREAIETAVKGLAQRAHAKGLEILVSVPASVPEGVVGDPQRLRQVLVNLVSNAVKFTERGEIIVRVETRRRDGDTATLDFSVQDTGIGIPLEKQALVFECFSQADASTTRKFGGTGLGLSICSQLVELMGGRMALESRPGQGSRFSFEVTLPLDPGFGSAVSPLPCLEGMRALVIDDNAATCNMLVELLTAWRMAPVAAASVAEALTRADTAWDGPGVGMILLDTHLAAPDVSSICRSLRAQLGRETPIVLLRGLAATTDPATERERIGRSASVHKPIAASHLLETLQALATDLPRAAISAPAPQPSGRSLRVLVAEDHPANRKLVSALLSKAGHRVTLVENGRLALDALENQAFDIVLMDVQMPLMDGFETSQMIRQREHLAGVGAHVPIVALTAQAMKGDRERCLAAGMDAYLTKPLDPTTLGATIDALVPHPAAPPAQPAALSEPDADPPPPTQTLRAPPRPGSPAPAAPTFRREELLERCGGDEELVQELVQIFLEQGPVMLQAISGEIERAKLEALASSTHRLKGLLLNLAAPRASLLAEELEALARRREIDGAAPILGQLAEAMTSLRDELRAPTRRT